MSAVSFSDSFKPGRAPRGIDVDNPVYGSLISHARNMPTDTSDDSNVCAAFYRRQFLVALKYDNHNFVVAINTLDLQGEKYVEVKTPEHARQIAMNRARASFKDARLDLGALISAKVLPDCSETRETMGVSGETDHIERSPVWSNAA